MASRGMFGYNDSEASNEYDTSDARDFSSTSVSPDSSYDSYCIPLAPPPPLLRKKEWELNAASELTDTSDKRVGSDVIKKVLEYCKQSNIKVLSHSALETDWNPIIHLRFEGVNRVNTRLLGSICSVTDPDDVTLDISDLGSPLKATLDVSFCKRSMLHTYKRTDRVYGKTIYVDTNQMLSSESIESLTKQSAEKDAFPETFMEHDVPMIKRIIKEVHNMEMFMPVLHLSITYKSDDNRYVISFNGIRTVAMSFVEHLLATCNNRIADIVISASGTEDRTLDVHLLPYGHKAIVGIRSISSTKKEAITTDDNNNNSKRSIVSNVISMLKRSRH
jgi:hypothetical protein